jgi:D-tyrosyl-tRNA(Tyr) deacylase
MRAVLQRVTAGSVTVDGRIVGQIGPGYVILLGVTPTDGPAELKKLVDNTGNLRVFEDEQGKMNRSVLEAGGEILVVSQFTLLADTKKAAAPALSTPPRRNWPSRWWPNLSRRCGRRESPKWLPESLGRTCMCTSKTTGR